MKIPSGTKKRDSLARLDFYLQLKERCLVSRTERREQYTSNRFYWLYGTDGSYTNEDTDTGLGPPPGNKIWPHVELLTSMLYAQDTTRFSVEIPPSVNNRYMLMIDALNDYVNGEWHSSNTDISFGLALALALVYGTTLIKPLWKKNGLSPGIVLPHNFGVLREDSYDLSKQEAFIHCYTTTPSQFRNDYGALPRFDQIFRQITKSAENILPSDTGIARIIMSSQDPLGTGGEGGNGVGVVDWLTQVSAMYVPRVQEQLIEMYELYVYDDDIGDYRIVTMASPEVPIFDRPLASCGWLQNQTPFVQLCPNPDPNYFWGIAEVERLIPLQCYRNRCMAEIDHLQELEAHPPSTASGFPSDLLEMQYTLDTPNGFMNQPDPAGVGGGGPKADRIKIEVPQDLYQRIDRCDAMFDDMSGLPPIVQGKGSPGVRSGPHASELAKLGSSRAKKRALVVEDSLEELATLYLRLLAKYDDAHLTGTDGVEFVAAQFPDDFAVKVDAHSNSPIFADDQTALAFQLLKVGAITKERFLDMISVQNRRQLKYELKTIIEPAQAKAHQEELALEKERIERGAAGRPKNVAKKNGAAAAAS